MESTCLWNRLPFACRSVVINLGCDDGLVIWFSAVIPWERKSRKMTLNYQCISFTEALPSFRSFWIFLFPPLSLLVPWPQCGTACFCSQLLWCSLFELVLGWVSRTTLLWMLQEAGEDLPVSGLMDVTLGPLSCQPGSWCWDTQVRG